MHYSSLFLLVYLRCVGAQFGKCELPSSSEILSIATRVIEPEEESYNVTSNMTFLCLSATDTYMKYRSASIAIQYYNMTDTLYGQFEVSELDISLCISHCISFF